MSINVLGISWSYGSRLILNNVSLEVRAGEFVVIQGGSGEGKSTLLNCILGLLVPKEGNIDICGTDITKLNREKRAKLRRDHIGVIFQHGGLISGLTAEENVALPTLLGQSNREIIPKAERLLRKMSVPTGRDVDALSGGEYQRVAMARALINDPEILVADEPTASLDPKLRDQVYEMLREATTQRKTATLVVTHDEHAHRYATRLLHLENCKLVEI